jgi:hypothetical protein
MSHTWLTTIEPPTQALPELPATCAFLRCSALRMLANPCTTYLLHSTRRVASRLAAQQPWSGGHAFCSGQLAIRQRGGRCGCAPTQGPPDRCSSWRVPTPCYLPTLPRLPLVPIWLVLWTQKCPPTSNKLAQRGADLLPASKPAAAAAGCAVPAAPACTPCICFCAATTQQKVPVYLSYLTTKLSRDQRPAACPTSRRKTWLPQGCTNPC